MEEKRRKNEKGKMKKKEEISVEDDVSTSKTEFHNRRRTRYSA